MNEVKWIKICTDVFDNRKIKQIETLPDGDSIIVIWFKLLCLSGKINDKGMLYLTEEVPYTDEMLATQFNRPLKTVQLAMTTFQQFKMIEIIDDILHISNWENYQNVEGMEKVREQTKKRVQKHREKQKLLECNVTVTQCNAPDIDIDKEKDINNIYGQDDLDQTGSNNKNDLEEPKKEIWEEQFEKFYKEYPKKVKKQDVRKWFKKNKPSSKLFSSMMSSLEQFRGSKDWLKEKGQYIPYPSTWLNQKRWEDEAIEEKTQVKDKSQELKELNVEDMSEEEYQKLVRGD